MPPTMETTAQIEARILRWMIMAGIAAAATMGALYGGRWAGGIAAGGAISVAGYYWIMQAVAGALSGQAARVTKGLVLKVILRYPILLGALYLFYRTKWLPMGAVAAGLFVPLAGGVVECLYQAGGMVFPARRAPPRE